MDTQVADSLEVAIERVRAMLSAVVEVDSMLSRVHMFYVWSNGAGWDIGEGDLMAGWGAISNLASYLGPSHESN